MTGLPFVRLVEPKIKIYFGFYSPDQATCDARLEAAQGQIVSMIEAML